MHRETARGAIDKALKLTPGNGSLQEALSTNATTERYDTQLLREYQAAGDETGAAQIKQLMIFNEGLDQVLRCRLALEQSLKESLVDPDAFAKAGSSTIDTTLDDLLLDKNKLTDDCPAATQYVAPGGELEKQLATAAKRAVAQREGRKLVEKARDDLLSDSWWARSSGPDIAARIKFLCDGVEDLGAVLGPGEAAASAGKSALMKTLGVAAKSIKAAYDNGESVMAAVRAAVATVNEELAQIVTEKLAEQLKLSPVYGTLKLLTDQQEYLRTLKEAGEYRDQVQERVRKLDEQLGNLQAQISVEEEKQSALLALQRDVLSTCAPPALEIAPRQ